jgi:hypothetical protein
MGILADNTNLNPGQFPHVTSTHPLSRYGTEHPVDKVLWGVDRAKEIHAKLKSKKVKPHEVLAGVSAAQGRGGS